MAEVVERVANLEGRFDAQAQQLDDIKESLVRLEDKMDRRFDAVDRRFTAVESRVTALEGSTNARFTSIDNRFDGFERFHQIADMTEFDIDRVARQLKGFRSRIYREDWIGQARLLQNQKNKSPS
jgi:uncharacterized coiled-coil protein SlyX